MRKPPTTQDEITTEIEALRIAAEVLKREARNQQSAGETGARMAAGLLGAAEFIRIVLQNSFKVMLTDGTAQTVDIDAKQKEPMPAPQQVAEEVKMTSDEAITILRRNGYVIMADRSASAHWVLRCNGGKPYTVNLPQLLQRAENVQRSLNRKAH